VPVQANIIQTSINSEPDEGKPCLPDITNQVIITTMTFKAQADWIAPSVDEDGLAVANNKFNLKQN